MKHPMFSFAVLAVALLIASALPCSAKTIYVKWDSIAPTPTGISWNAAFRTVQEGLNAAVAGDEVWVAKGRYWESITLKDSVGLYGGFVGTETARDQRDWVTNVTILESGWGAVVYAPPEATRSTRIDGFTIRNGYWTNMVGAASLSGGSGAGISCYDSASPTIVNNLITGNYGDSGGGIGCSDGGSPLIVNNTIVGNSAIQGGGIFCEAGASPTIAGNLIAQNGAWGGGGILLLDSSPIITNNTIIGNTADYGGGILCWSQSSPTISNNVVAFNSSGVCNDSLNQSKAVLRNNCLYGNAGVDYYGLEPGTGDISADPLLACREYGNTHIRPGSPCIDAGDDSAVDPSWVDIDHQPRIRGAHADIGADESDGAEWPAGPYAVIRVSPSGDDADDGSTWELAKRTLQAAIDSASALGGEVWVQAGTYYGHFELRLYAYVYGGFAGTETARDQRNWAANRTILDGESFGPIVTITVGDHVSALDGFTIRNGDGMWGDVGSYGGVVHCIFSSPTIANNTIAGNRRDGLSCDYAQCSPTIFNNVITHNAGRGITSAGSHSIISNNTISDNSESGMYLYNSSAQIANNIVAFNGSGLVNYSGKPVLSNNCVYGNTSANYSGLDPGTNDIQADPLLAGRKYGNIHIQPDSPCRDAGDDSVIGPNRLDIDHEARIRGLHVDIGADESDGTAWSSGPYAVVRVSPSGNDANDGSDWALAKKTVQAAIDSASMLGGEVWVRAGTYHEHIMLRPYGYIYGGFAGSETARLDRNWSANKSILDGNANGTVVKVLTGENVSSIDGFTIQNGGDSPDWVLDCGGVFCNSGSPVIANNIIRGNNASRGGGGISCWESASPTITNNIITGNTGYWAGGIFCSGTANITNNTIVGNVGGISCYDSSPTISNNVIAFNDWGIANVAPCGIEPILQTNCVYGNGHNYYHTPPGPDDIHLNPVLADRAGGDFHISAGSPCIDAGRPAAPGLPLFDFDSQARIYGPSVDIGADEYWPPNARLYEARQVLDGAKVSLNGSIVTAAFDGFFYIEAEDRSCGIRIEKASHGVDAGDRVNVTGVLKTNQDGERYIEAASVEVTGTGSIRPVFINSRALGGADWFYNPATGAGQCGVVDGLGLSNIGLLVKTWGKVTYLDGAYALNKTAKVLLEGLSIGGETYVRITGISSCYRDTDGLHPTILPTEITPLQ